MLDEPRLLAANPLVTRRPITVAKYHLIGEVDILGDRDYVELMEGKLVATAPIGSYHNATVITLTQLLCRAAGDRALASVQGPIRLDEFSEPGAVEVCRQPRPDGYTMVQRLGRNGVLEPELLPGVRIQASSLFR